MKLGRKEANKGCDLKPVTTVGDWNLILLGNLREQHRISALKLSPSARVFLHHSYPSLVKASGRAACVHPRHSVLLCDTDRESLQAKRHQC